MSTLSDIAYQLHLVRCGQHSWYSTYHLPQALETYAPVAAVVPWKVSKEIQVMEESHAAG